MCVRDCERVGKLCSCWQHLRWQSEVFAGPRRPSPSAPVQAAIGPRPCAGSAEEPEETWGFMWRLGWHIGGKRMLRAQVSGHGYQESFLEVGGCPQGVS